jgi:hypothetical protein
MSLIRNLAIVPSSNEVGAITGLSLILTSHTCSGTAARKDFGEVE